MAHLAAAALTAPKTFLAGSARVAHKSIRPTTPSAPSRLIARAALSVKRGDTSTDSKVLVAGRDIKAQQFQVDLGPLGKKTLSLGFTKSNELLVGRMAMLGVATSLIGEVLTGKGALAQLGYETGVPITDIDGAIVGVILFNLVAALLPARGRFVPDEEELREREPGALQDPKIALDDPLRFLGIKGFGFTKENELFVGRLAQLGFAASLVGEALTGSGILGQIGLETGIPLSQAEPLLLASIAFTLFAAINQGTGKFVDEEA